MAARVSFSIRTKDPGSYARTGTLKLAHGEVRTPAFVPLATKAVVKTLEVREAGELGFDMVLGNTFHLFLSPGHDLIAKLGGNWAKRRWRRISRGRTVINGDAGDAAGAVAETKNRAIGPVPDASYGLTGRRRNRSSRSH